MEDKYTGGEWDIFKQRLTGCIPYDVYGIEDARDEEGEANLIRLRLCVSVLSDFSNEALESGVVGEMETMLYDIKHYWSNMAGVIPVNPKLESRLKSILSKLEADNG